MTIDLKLQNSLSENLFEGVPSSLYNLIKSVPDCCHHFPCHSNIPYYMMYFPFLCSQGKYLVRCLLSHSAKCSAVTCPSAIEALGQVICLTRLQYDTFLGQKMDFWNWHCGKCPKRHCVVWSPGLVLPVKQQNDWVSIKITIKSAAITSCLMHRTGQFVHFVYHRLK